jgi:hypothetical protein
LFVTQTIARYKYKNKGSSYVPDAGYAKVNDRILPLKIV